MYKRSLTARRANVDLELIPLCGSVTMHLVRNGVDRSTFNKGVTEWRKRNKH